jgi:hypothetical protein
MRRTLKLSRGVSDSTANGNHVPPPTFGRNGLFHPMFHVRMKQAIAAKGAHGSRHGRGPRPRTPERRGEPASGRPDGKPRPGSDFGPRPESLYERKRLLIGAEPSNRAPGPGTLFNLGAFLAPGLFFRPRPVSINQRVYFSLNRNMYAFQIGRSNSLTQPLERLN